VIFGSRGSKLSVGVSVAFAGAAKADAGEAAAKVPTPASAFAARNFFRENDKLHLNYTKWLRD
jgi:hypothetical protein